MSPPAAGEGVEDGVGLTVGVGETVGAAAFWLPVHAPTHRHVATATNSPSEVVLVT